MPLVRSISTQAISLAKFGDKCFRLLTVRRDSPASGGRQSKRTALRRGVATPHGKPTTRDNARSGAYSAGQLAEEPALGIHGAFALGVVQQANIARPSWWFEPQSSDMSSA